MVKPIIGSFNTLPEMTIQPYQRYLPTAFNEAPTMLEKVNMMAEYLNQVGKLNNDVVTQWNSVMEWVMNEQLGEDVKVKLDEMANDGTLDTIINQNIFSELNSELSVNTKNISNNTQSIQEQASKIDKRMLLFEADENTDITASLNAMIGTGGKHIKIVNGTFLVNAGTSIVLKNDTVLEFSPKTVLKAIPNSLTNYSILKVDDCTNVKILNPVLIGERLEHAGTTGEWGMGINIRGSKDVYVLNPIVSNCWGDGIYIGETANKSFSENVKIVNPVCDNNRRQGISIVSAKNLTIDSPVVKNTNGTAPQSGIDIEPNNNGNMLENIRIKNMYSEKNVGGGLLLALAQMKDSNNYIDIVIDGLVDVRSESALVVTGAIGNAYGKIEINDIMSKYAQATGINIRNYSVNFPHLLIRNPIVTNPNEKGYTSVKYGGGITVFSDAGDNNNDSIGNVTFENPTVMDNRTTKLIKDGIYVQNNSGNNIQMSNVNILNPRRLDDTTGVKLQMYAKGIIKDDYGVLEKDLAGASQSLNRYDFRKKYHNATSAGTRTFTLPETIHDDCPSIIIEVRNAQPIQIVPTNLLIQPLTTVAGKYISSSTVGSLIELKKENGQWKVKNMVGSWSVQP